MIRKIKNYYHLVVAVGANIYFGFPAKKIKVIGVTGTDGKTTTASMINHILKSNGKSTSILTSLGAEIDDEEIDTGFHVTTPSPFALQRLIKKAVDKESEYFVLEVTSHAIDQHRIWGIPFKISVLTNITNEHLDYHKTYEKYANTKFKLLKSSKVALINKNDKSYDFFKKTYKLKELQKLFTYGFSKDADINETSFRIESKSIQGDFNKLNALAASACCELIGFKKKNIEKSFSTYQMPIGRFEYIYKKEFSILVDFAHTPNAFEKVLKTIRPETKGRIIHVFGSAGERDKVKRPELGFESSKYSDIIILTSEDPRSENVETINDEISKGIENGVKVLNINDREAAIRKAIDMAEHGDLILLTGKSHEKSMTIGKKEYNWNEYDIANKALENKNK